MPQCHSPRGWAFLAVPAHGQIPHYPFSHEAMHTADRVLFYVLQARSALRLCRWLLSTRDPDACSVFDSRVYETGFPN